MHCEWLRYTYIVHKLEYHQSVTSYRQVSTIPALSHGKPTATRKKIGGRFQMGLSALS